jgi:hypothetical protein
MAKDSIRDFSATAGSNTDIQSVNIDENCPASGINNAIRELMVDLKNVSTGAVNLETPAADQLNVDNIRIDGNTISSTDTNGDITLDPAGTGDTVMTGSGGQVTIDENGHITSKQSLDAATAGGRIVGASNRGTVGQIGIEQSATGADGGHIQLSTCASGSTSPTERMRIINSGFVGFNKSSPTARLHAGFTGADQENSLILEGSNGSSEAFTFEVNANGAGSAARFLIGSGGGAATERLRIESGGQLRANTTGAFNSVTSITPVVHVDINATTSSFNGGVAVGGIGSGEVAFSAMAGSSVDYYSAIFHNSGASVVGSIFSTTSSTAFNTSSDYRMKENVVDITGAITRVKQLAPKRFNFIIAPEKTVDGFLAHEAQAVVPESVTGEKDAVDDNGKEIMQGIDQSKLVPLLCAALKESIAKIETLETEMTALKARVTALEA